MWNVNETRKVVAVKIDPFFFFWEEGKKKKKKVTQLYYYIIYDIYFYNKICYIMIYKLNKQSLIKSM